MEGITFSSEAIKILDYLCEKFGIAIDWTNVNIIPKLAELSNKIVLWKETLAKFWIIFGEVLFILGLGLMIWGAIKEKHSHSYSIGWLWLIAFGVFIVLIGITLFCEFMCNYIKCNTFPELVIIEYLEKIMAGVQL